MTGFKINLLLSTIVDGLTQHDRQLNLNFLTQDLLEVWSYLLKLSMKKVQAKNGIDQKCAPAAAPLRARDTKLG